MLFVVRRPRGVSSFFFWKAGCFAKPCVGSGKGLLLEESKEGEGRERMLNSLNDRVVVAEWQSWDVWVYPKR
jgi:hypothetical protein